MNTALLDEISAYVSALPAVLKEKQGTYSFEKLIAERKAFLSSQKLIYKGRYTVDEEKKELRFTEQLVETGFGLGGGEGISPGFGFKTETYSTLGGARKGTLEERSAYFGKKYSYSFDYAKIRKDIEGLAKKAGYRFIYSIV